MRLSVVVPCYNESAYVGESLRRLAGVPAVTEIVVVDDCSTDGTRDILQRIAAAWPPGRPVFRLFLHPVNRGKGAALRTGFRHVTGEITAIHDADLEYDPRDLETLIRPILDGDADVVYGSRFAGFPRRVLFFWHSVGNRILTTLSNMATNLNLSDMETCYKVFRSDILRGIPIRSNTFGFEPEVTAKFAKLGCRVYEVPISYHGRSYAEGKKINWKHGLQALGIILKYAFVDDLGVDRGHATLNLLRKTGRYNGWLYGKIRPWLQGKILEVGSGIGNITSHLVGSGRVTASDLSPVYLRELTRTFAHRPDVTVKFLDITRPVAGPPAYDTVVCLNVLEHIEDDVAALRNIHAMLRPGGRLVLLVPANPRLYCGIDRDIGHFRRYRKDALVRTMSAAGFRVWHARYQNMLGAAGWLVQGKILNRRSITRGGLRGFNLLMPLLEWTERIESPFSLSVLVVGVKGEPGHTRPGRIG